MKNKLKKIVIAFILFISIYNLSWAQVENVPIVNPVYDFLLRSETKGYLPNFSLSQLPLQRKKIVEALKLVREHEDNLTNAERKILEQFELEFEIQKPETAVLFYSESDTNQVFSKKMFSNCEKSFYRYRSNDSTKAITSVTFDPIAGLDFLYKFDNNNKNNNLLIGTLGGRLFGTLTNHLGYYLQITNAAMLYGNDSLALLDKKYFNNNKFRKLNSDADISESHVAFEYDWFYSSIGRETRLEGAGLSQRIFINNLSPAFDAITLAARFSNFEYKFSHNSLLNFPVASDMGYATVIPPKYVAMHTFSFRPTWGEINLFESVIYTRELDLAYLNPLSFLKSLEHSQHDRDNSGMGISGVFRPMKNLQLKASWFLDDIIISKIGTGFWSNKTAWNIAGIVALPNNLDIGIEYTRVEPYTYSHFNPQNSNVNDSILFSSMISPNSDRLTALFQFWYGERYPLKLSINYTRHGANIYDESGELIFNAGGDPLQSIRWGKDSEKVNFLDGNLEKIFAIELSAGIEIIRGFNIQFYYNFQRKNKENLNVGRIIFRFNDF